MNYEEAMQLFSKYYVDRSTVEFPTILKMCNFKDKRVLEIGPAEGYFKEEVSKIAGEVQTFGVTEELPFEDKSFDIVFSRWVVHGFDDVEKAVKEMCRVAKESVMIVLPSDEGDETKLLEIREKGKAQMRKERVLDIRKWIEESGFRVREERRQVKFIFPDVNEATDIFVQIGFDGKASEEEHSRLHDFLMSKRDQGKISLTQGAAFICASRA
jgi:SAM-dependent methyltransferase